MILLYEHPLSPYAQKVKIGLAEKGIPFTTRLPAAFGSGAVQDEEFKRERALGIEAHETIVL
jgi:glutathione S-transferase